MPLQVDVNIKIAVCVGEFQPLTTCQVETINELLLAGNSVIVALTYCGKTRSLQQPWLEAERRAMLTAVYGTDAGHDLRIVSLPESRYDDRYSAMLLRHALTVPASRGVAMIACDTHSERYLKWFPECVPRSLGPNDDVLEAVLTHFFEARMSAGVAPPASSTSVPASIWPLLESVATKREFQRLREDYEHVAAHRTMWQAAPYAPILVTVDALVTWREHVLLIRRARPPGRGLWALPGGFLDPDETLAAAARRELHEETGLALDSLAPPASLVAIRVFDAPRRSVRGRTITHCFHYRLAAHSDRPNVRGDDDAAHASWLPLTQIAALGWFEDHYAILQVMLGCE